MDFWTVKHDLYRPEKDVIDPELGDVSVDPVTIGDELDEEYRVLFDELTDGAARCCRGR